MSAVKWSTRSLRSESPEPAINRKQRPMLQRYLLVLAFALPAGSLAADFYKIQVVDAATGRGVPLVELSPQNGTTMITDSNGIVAFNQSALMNQNVSFGLQSYGYANANQALHPTNGGSVQIP